jgi:hypothetical protein
LRYSYDHLVVATGATHSYFGHDEWASLAPGLKRIEDATRIRRNILLAFERAEATEDPAARERYLTFTIVGGGATGVEMAGAISEVAQQSLARDFRRVDPRQAKIILVEAAPRLLGAFPEDLSAYTYRALQKMGVDVRLNTRVMSLDARGADTSAGRIESATLIWAAGVRASKAAQWLGAESDAAGRVIVDDHLRLTDDERVFVIGDTASVKLANGGRAPGIAPALHSRRICGRDEPALRLQTFRRPRHDRQESRRREAGFNGAHRVRRLAGVEPGAHLLPHWSAQSLHRRAELDVHVPDIPARRPAGDAARGKRRGKINHDTFARAAMIDIVLIAILATLVWLAVWFAYPHRL